MTVALKESLLQARLKNKEVMATAFRRMDLFRRKYGKAEKGFNSTSLLRQLRDNR